MSGCGRKINIHLIRKMIELCLRYFFRIFNTTNSGAFFRMMLEVPMLFLVETAQGFTGEIGGRDAGHTVKYFVEKSRYDQQFTFSHAG